MAQLVSDQTNGSISKLEHIHTKEVNSPIVNVRVYQGKYEGISYNDGYWKWETDLITSQPSAAPHMMEQLF